MKSKIKTNKKCCLLKVIEFKSNPEKAFCIVFFWALCLDPIVSFYSPHNLSTILHKNTLENHPQMQEYEYKYDLRTNGRVKL